MRTSHRQIGQNGHTPWGPPEMSDLYCDAPNKNTFGNVRFVCMSNLIIGLDFGKIAYNNNKKGGQNDYTSTK